MQVLVINCGSSSLRFALLDPETGERALGGHVERIGAVSPLASVRSGEDTRRTPVQAADHAGAMRFVVAQLEAAVAAGVAAVGHRVVHGGERFTGAACIDDEAERAIEEAYDLAPLHNPANLAGIRAARAALPHATHVAVFDTAFHHTLPEQAYHYAIPERLYRRHGLRRYGFHGPSHYYVSRRLFELSGLAPAGSRVITCHLGNGASMCALRDGRSVDTSMGMTPLAGLVMGSRCGDVDPSLVFELVEKEELSLAEVHALLNRHSGLLGVSGLSPDMRDVLAAAAEGDARCERAVALFCYRAKSYLGQYFAVLNGCDAIVFTAGIGEHSAPVRARICTGLDALGVRLDAGRNAAAPVGEARRISADDSAVQVWVVPTDEERVIGAEALRVSQAGERA